MDILKLKRIDTRPNTDIPFWENTPEQLEYYQKTWFEPKIQISDEIKISDDGLTKTRTATYNGIPGLAEMLGGDTKLIEFQQEHAAYCKANGITRSGLIFEAYNEQGVQLLAGEHLSA